MKKQIFTVNNIRLIIVSIIIAVLLSSSIISSATLILNIPKFDIESETYNEKPNKKWTFMLYDDSDFTCASHILDDFIEKAYSTDNVSVIAMEDRWLNPKGAKYCYVDENHNEIILETMNEVNMGNADTLKNFVQYCKDEYPAERFILAIYNHGYGWEGCCKDVKSNGDILTMDEMKESLTESGKVDLLCFTGPCFMASLESIYELRDCTDVYIASQETSNYLYWEDIVETLCTTLDQESDISNFKLAKNIIDWIIENAESSDICNEKKLTMSAIKTSEINILVNSINRLSKHIYENFNVFSNNLKIAHNNSKEVGNYYGGIDLYNFIENYYEIEDNNKILEYLDDIFINFSNAIIKTYIGDNHTGDNGFSIYFPPSSNYKTKYTNCDLDFTHDTYWDDLIVKSFGKAKSHNLNWMNNLLFRFPFLNHLKEKYHYILEYLTSK